jgi:serine/threonine-protein kinase
VADPREPVDPVDETVVRDEWSDETVVVDEREEIVPPRRPPLLWPWLLAFLVLVLGGLGAYWYFSQEDTSTVPAVVGQRQDAAEADVRAAGFEPQSEQAESAKPKGLVIAQRPEGGSELEDGKTVFLTVSAGPPRETVPDVVGQTQEAAIADLTTAKFKADVTQAFSDKQAGVVIAQDPKAGANLKEGSAVALTVSKGRKPVEVPDVVGTTSSEATATLREAGLEANLVPVPSGRPGGTVLAQSPKAGATAKSGTKVRLNVAQSPGATTPATTQAATTQATTTAPTPTQPPASATVPDAVGKELAVAAREFGDAGLKVAVKLVPSNEARGTVIAQAQPAGTERKRGDTVQVNVALGANPPANATVPSTAGKPEQEARDQLEAAGFEVLAIPFETADRSRDGRVLSQTPGGNAQIPGGSLVILYVGTATS